MKIQIKMGGKYSQPSICYFSKAAVTCACPPLPPRFRARLWDGLVRGCSELAAWPLSTGGYDLRLEDEKGRALPSSVFRWSISLGFLVRDGCTAGADTTAEVLTATPFAAGVDFSALGGFGGLGEGGGPGSYSGLEGLHAIPDELRRRPSTASKE